MSDQPNRRGEAEKLENQIEENVNLNIQNTEDESGQRNIIKKSHETQKKDTLEQSRDYIVMDKPNVLLPLREINKELEEGQ